MNETLRMVDFSLVLPTYNERENLAPLLARLAKALQRYTYEIIVVDDDSPDRTWEEAERLRAVFPQVSVIRRVGEQGLSSAVIRGFREAKGRMLGVMDADLQHDESILPRLIDELVDADFAVASRATEGGGLGKWQWHRRIKSWVATVLAQLVLNVPLSDPMSGYFIVKQKIFAALDDGTLSPKGFKILLYLYFHACQKLGMQNVRVSEVGYVFRNRIYGESKLTHRVVLEYIKMLYDLRRGSLLPYRLVRFGCVGALGVAVNCGVFLFLHYYFGVHYLLAACLAIETTILHNFALNELWTFRNYQNHHADTRWFRFGKFHTVSLGGMGINLSILALMADLIGLPLLLSNLMGIGSGIVWNYAANKLWTWKVAYESLGQMSVSSGNGGKPSPSGESHGITDTLHGVYPGGINGSG
jgi:dolichol-phosphate mannosyltransferase